LSIRTTTARSLAAILLLAWGSGSGGLATELPAYMLPIAGAVTTSPAEVANDNVLALNTSMFQLYGDASKVFQRNILARHPVILGLFSGAGGRFILYRPGAPPLEAPPVQVVYQLLKSVGHSAMALTEVISPYIDNPANQAWRASLLAYRSQMQSALDTLDAADLPAEALVQIARAGKRPVLYCRDFKLGARHSTLQAQVGLGHPDVPVRVIPCGNRMADNYVVCGLSRLTSRAGLSSRKPTKTVWRRRPSSGQLR
jgi:hypothetical protein